MLAGGCIPAQRAAFLLALLIINGAARGADFGEVGDFDIRLDTTLRETMGLRTGGEQSGVLADINADDGDRAFPHGLISARTDIATELTAEHGDLGFDLSADGWYDPVYQGQSGGDSPATFNPVSVHYDQFPAATRRLLGGDAELDNAFVQDRVDIAGLPVSVRLGRQTLLWGESLFFASNGIAGGQAPVDTIKSLNAPLATARELYLPVTQLFARIELRPGLAIEAYDQVEWRRDRLPGVASYFSTTDILDAGGERLLLPNWGPLYRTADSTPNGFGQFGLALRAQSDRVDLGLYALRFDAKSPQPVYKESAGTYHLIFPRGIELYGASFSTYAGSGTISGEISFRRNMPLLAGGPSLGGSAAIGGGGIYAAAELPVSTYYPPQPPAPLTSGFAVGETWQAQLSYEAQLPPSRWWQGATIQSELATNDLVDVTGGHPYVLAGRTHFAASWQGVFTPQYFQVLPGLDITLPLGLGYTPIGRSSIDSAMYAGAGDATVSVSATYRQVWQGAVSFTHFIGGATAQKLADRDFVSVSVARTF